jgi:hypothetical protein
MKLEDARENYYTLTGKASDVARQLAFAGIAVIWVFKVDAGPDNLGVPPSLHGAGLWLVVALSLDLLHYAIGSAISGSFHRLQERKDTVSAETEFEAPPWVNWPMIVCFWSKIASVGIAYTLILRHVARLL